MKVLPLKRTVSLVSVLVGICFLSMISSVSFGTPENAAPRDTTKVKKTKTKGKKKRVPKKKVTPTTTDENTIIVESEKDESFFESCLGSCLGSFIDILFGGGGDDEDDDEIDVTNDYSANYPEFQPSAATEPPARDIVLPDLPCAAIVAPQGTSKTAGCIWDKPGGISAGAAPQAKLTAGTEISIISEYTPMRYGIQEDTWVQIKMEGSPVEGWMLLFDVELVGSGDVFKNNNIEPMPIITNPQTPLTDPTKAEPTSIKQKSDDAAEQSLSELLDNTEPTIKRDPSTAPQIDQAVDSEYPSESLEQMKPMQTVGYHDVGNSRWQLVLDFSTPVFAVSALSKEYHYAKDDSSANNLGYEIGGTFKFLPIRLLLIDASFGYAHVKGTPQYDYVVDNERDSPQESALSIFSMRLGAGQLYSFSGGKGFFTWSIGPSLYKVTESANIAMYRGDDLVGHRKDELSTWRAGADIKMEIGGAPVDRLPIAFYTRVSIVSWESKQEKALTLDYLGRKAFTFFNFGLSIGLAFY